MRGNGPQDPPRSRHVPFQLTYVSLVVASGQPLGDGSISFEKLEQLLAVGGELDDLDFKTFLDLGHAKDKIELIKDLGAFQSHPSGGYIVVGADNSGTPTTAHGVLDARQFDPANLTQIAHPYLPTVRINATTHDVGGITVAMIYVGQPSPPGLAIFVKDGQYPDKNGSRTAFRCGDVFVRRGTQSVRWQPSDVGRALKDWEEHIREDERRRAAAYAQTLLAGQRARAVASGPIGALAWRLPADDFEAALLEAIRARDTIALRSLALSFSGDAAALLESEEESERELLLERLTAALALTVTYDQEGFFTQFLEVFVNLYRLAIDEFGNPRPSSDQRFASFLWSIAVAIEAVGGLAVRLSALWAVRPLAMPPKLLTRLIGEPSWIRHSLTAAAQRNLLLTVSRGDEERSVPIGGPVVAVARQLVERIPALRPDTQVSRFELNSAPEPNDLVLNSLIQFDALWCVIAVAHTRSVWHHYPSMAAFYGSRATPAFELLINDADARATLMDGDEDNLREAMQSVIKTANELSRTDYRRPWDFDSPMIGEFLRETGDRND